MQFYLPESSLLRLFVILFSPTLRLSYGRPKAFKQLFVAKRLVQECNSSSLHCLASRFFVPVTTYENDRDGPALGSEMPLEL